MNQNNIDGLDMMTASAAARAEALSARHIAMSDGMVVTCFENEVPSFVATELERLYESLFSSYPQFLVHGDMENLSTYMVCQGHAIVVLWLFRRHGRRIRIVNEAITVKEVEVRRFAEFVFATYPSVQVIEFHAVEIQIEKVPFTWQRHNCTEDSVLALPATSDDYLDQLGKATRRNIRRYTARLKEAFPSFHYSFQAGANVPETEIRAIISLNRIRMANKNKISGIDATEEEKIIRLVRLCGWVGIAKIEGKVCAGAIVYRIGANYFSFVRAHDPAYDEYRLGIVGAFLLVSECISRGGKELHFMWGREAHKSLLAGAQRDFDRILVHRSYFSMAKNMNTVFKTALQGRMRRYRLALLDKARQDGRLDALILRRVIHGMRGLKSLAARSVAPK